MINDLMEVAEQANKLAQEATEKLVQERNALAAENETLKYQEPKLAAMMSCLDAFYADEGVPERAMMAAYNILRKSVGTPATDAFLAEVRASARNEGINYAASRLAAAFNHGFLDLSQPVDPQVTEYEQIMLRAGWVMVPVEPTDEMIAAAMECDDVVFDSKDPTAFCVQYREIYYAMVDAAPKQEGNNG
ncbi:hypothetical protein RF884_002645 [Salmonella enterica]|nr:hypothetical protein [Salmonella enterica]EIS0991114.1 hypothetical protein [Salmonella enterica]ELA6485420.1 hypothetical protein [Salmonella enterica]